MTKLGHGVEKYIGWPDMSSYLIFHISGAIPIFGNPTYIREGPPTPFGDEGRTQLLKPRECPVLSRSGNLCIFITQEKPSTQIRNFVDFFCEIMIRWYFLDDSFF